MAKSAEGTQPLNKIMVGLSLDTNWDLKALANTKNQLNSISKVGHGLIDSVDWFWISDSLKSVISLALQFNLPLQPYTFCEYRHI